MSQHSVEDLGLKCFDICCRDHGSRDVVAYVLVKWSAWQRTPSVQFPSEFGTYFIDPLKGWKAEPTLPSPRIEPKPCEWQRNALTTGPPGFKELLKHILSNAFNKNSFLSIKIKHLEKYSFLPTFKVLYLFTFLILHLKKAWVQK